MVMSPAPAQPLLADPAGRQHARVRARGIRPGAGNVAKARTRRRRPVEPLISRAACLRPGPAFIPPGRAAGPWVECPDRTVPWRHDRSRPVGRVGDGRRPCGRGWGPAGPDPPDLWAAPLDDAKARARVHEKVYRRGPGQCHYWLGSLSSSRHGRVRPGVRTTTARRPARCQRRASRPVNRARAVCCSIAGPCPSIAFIALTGALSRRDDPVPAGSFTAVIMSIATGGRGSAGWTSGSWTIGVAG